jgi:carbamate kinase
MNETIVILVNGEVLADSYKSAIADQKSSIALLADGLLPIFTSNLNIALMHGNKPQVGYVLFRSELASHILHQIPLDVCGADTQGATGYMLSQAISNVLRQSNRERKVMPIITQTIISSEKKYYEEKNKQIGPWLDRSKAEQRHQVYGWSIVEEPGYGYRRVVASPPPTGIVEIEGVKQLVQSGSIVITAGGGGVPVIVNKKGLLEGVEAVVDTDRVACMLAHQLEAKVLFMIVEDDAKFISSGFRINDYLHMSYKELDKILKGNAISSNMVMRKLNSAKNYLQRGGSQVVITTLEKLPSTLMKESGLWISDQNPTVDLSEIMSL